MGSMSASEPAPLPRLGEVFFDVRGSSRSMRLSWYADSGISVFSIWQGGTCTGTFRLPPEELPRLIDALRRGMHGADQRDPRGLSSYSRQLSGAPTDPRLTALPGYAGPRDGGFTGPVTGDFRALRPDDQDRGSGTRMLGSASPRALPPPAALPAGSYRDQPRYSEPEQYADQGYAERGYGVRGGYDDQGYGAPGEPGYQGYAYGDQGYADPRDPSYAAPSHSGQGYDDPSYPGQGYDAGFYPGRGYDPGYDDRGSVQRGYADQGYHERGRHEQPGYPDHAEQGYGRYGYSQQASQSQSLEVRANYPGTEGSAGSGGFAAYAEPGYQQQRGHAERGYPDPPGQAYADQGYDAYQYAEQEYGGPGYPGQDDPGQAYPEREYGGYPGEEPAGSAYQAGYGSAGYEGAGYGTAGYEAGGHYGAGYDGGGYVRARYEGGGYDGGYERRGYEGAGYDEGPGRSGGYRQMPPGRGPRGRAQYQDPDITPSQPVSSFPYDGGPPTGREYRRRRVRY